MGRRAGSKVRERSEEGRLFLRRKKEKKKVY